jgi:arylsulfatase A-like enzyme
MPDEFLNMYDPDDIELPPSFMEEYEFDFGVCGIRAEKLAAYPRQRAEIKRHIAEYYGMISHLDHEFGKVVQALKDNGIYDNTIIIFASDNGLALGQHAYMAKQNCYEHALRVPLIFAGNCIPKGEVRSQFAYIHEIFPTICDMIGIDIPETVEAESLLPIIQNNTEGRKYLYGGYGGLCRSVKDSRYKLIEYRYDGKKRRQLFDLESDPYEINDISADCKYADKIEELEAQMREFGVEWDDVSHELGKKFWDNY